MEKVEHCDSALITGAYVEFAKKKKQSQNRETSGTFGKNGVKRDENSNLPRNVRHTDSGFSQLEMTWNK